MSNESAGKTNGREEQVGIFDLAVKSGQLPVTLQDLAPLAFIGQTAVTYYREKIKLMDHLAMSEEQRKITLRDGQDAGKMLLAIEARIGELLPDSQEARSLGGRRGGENKKGKGSKVDSPLMGLDANRAHQARTIAKNPDAVEAVIAEAKENEDIPTKTAVLNKVQWEKVQAENNERYERMKNERKKAENTLMSETAKEELKAWHRIIEMVDKRTSVYEFEEERDRRMIKRTMDDLHLSINLKMKKVKKPETAKEAKPEVEKETARADTPNKAKTNGKKNEEGEKKTNGKKNGTDEKKPDTTSEEPKAT